METSPLIANAYSFAIACMGAATVFLFLQRSQVAAAYKSAVTLSGIVTLIACYHYSRIAYNFAAGIPADSYRYVDWLLTVPILLVEVILVMKLSAEESRNKATTLALLAVAMILLGYPGEISTDAATQQKWWFASMVPFVLIVTQLFVGLKNAINAQPASVRGLVSAARWVTVLTWSFYPVVYALRFTGLAAGSVEIQVGYTVADILSKAGVGMLVYAIAMRKTNAGA